MTEYKEFSLINVFLMLSAYFPPYVGVLPRKISAKMGCSVKSVMIPFMSEGLA